MGYLRGQFSDRTILRPNNENNSMSINAKILS